ncbi:hypothetical protein ACFRAU_07150 [Arthrobacter sp. NPDC056691]|uniref:hypothetical protein n=1 Tax=Arthrobacter sp. NPDC056691 TaxID=3345913 RepID=UPI00366C26C1
MEPEAVTERPGILLRNAWVLVIGAVLATVATVAGLTWAGQRGTISGQEAQISGIESQLAGIRQRNDERIDRDVLEALGVSRSRLDADRARIQSLLTIAFTWDSGLAYAAAREKLKERFGLAEGGPFLRNFMPPSRFNEDADGKRYYYIDTAGLNSTLGRDPDIEVVDVRAGNYSYAVLVDVEVTSDAVSRTRPGSVKADRRMLLFVIVDAEGRIAVLSGVPPSGTSRHSG